MKEELIQKTLTWIENTEEFLTREAPVFVEEILSYYLISNTASFAIATSIFVGLIFILAWGLKRAKANNFDEDEDLTMFSVIMPVFVGIPLFAFMIVKAFNVLKIVIAPRLFLIEQLSDMI